MTTPRIEEENWRSKYKGMEQSWMYLKDQYSELARALGFEGDAWFGDPLADHAEILSRAKALTQAHQAGIDEAKKTILHQLESHIDNIKYAPSKPSDYRAWQDGFMEAYQQARKVIQYGHTRVKSLDDTIKALQDNK